MIVEINNKRYLPMDVLVTEKNVNQMDAKKLKFGCIEQSVKEVDKGGFWNGASAVVTLLVPEENVLEFNK